MVIIIQPNAQAGQVELHGDALVELCVIYPA